MKRTSLTDMDMEGVATKEAVVGAMEAGAMEEEAVEAAAMEQEAMEAGAVEAAAMEEVAVVDMVVAAVAEETEGPGAKPTI